MFLSCYDVELLRLAGWCKNLPANLYRYFHAQMFSPTVIGMIKCFRLLSETKNGESLRLSDKGWELLHYLDYDYHRDAGYVSDYGRRLEISRILLTFYRADFNIFASHLEYLDAPFSFAQTPVLRRDSGELAGAVRFCGIASFPESIFACHYVEGHKRDPIYFEQEKKNLDGIASPSGRNTAFFYAGSSYLNAAKCLRGDSGKPVGGQKFSFAQIFKLSYQPVHLLECSDVGALQLLIMSQPQYRERLIQNVWNVESLMSHDLPDIDCVVELPDTEYPVPTVIAVDMDISRIDRAYRVAKDAGYLQLGVVCLPEQKAALRYLYDAAAIMALPCHLLTQVFGELNLYEAKQELFYDKQGEPVEPDNLPFLSY